MLDEFLYYVDWLVALCGFDGSDEFFAFGVAAVILAAATVIYAVYFGITRAIWPGEENTDHIKYRILEDEEAMDAH